MCDRWKCRRLCLTRLAGCRPICDRIDKALWSYSEQNNNNNSCAGVCGHIASTTWYFTRDWTGGDGEYRGDGGPPAPPAGQSSDCKTMPSNNAAAVTWHCDSALASMLFFVASQLATHSAAAKRWPLIGQVLSVMYHPKLSNGNGLS